MTKATESTIMGELLTKVTGQLAVEQERTELLQEAHTEAVIALADNRERTVALVEKWRVAADAIQNATPVPEMAIVRMQEKRILANDLEAATKEATA